MRVPPENRKYRLFANAPYSLPSREAQRNQFIKIKIPTVQIAKPIARILAQVRDRHRMVLLLSMNQDLVPSHALERPQSFPDQVQAITTNNVPAKRVNELHSANPPRWTLNVVAPRFRSTGQLLDVRDNPGLGLFVLPHSSKTTVIFSKGSERDLGVARRTRRQSHPCVFPRILAVRQIAQPLAFFAAVKLQDSIDGLAFRRG